MKLQKLIGFIYTILCVYVPDSTLKISKMIKVKEFV